MQKSILNFFAVTFLMTGTALADSNPFVGLWKIKQNDPACPIHVAISETEDGNIMVGTENSNVILEFGKFSAHQGSIHIYNNVQRSSETEIRASYDIAKGCAFHGIPVRFCQDWKQTRIVYSVGSDLNTLAISEQVRTKAIDGEGQQRFCRFIRLSAKKPE